MTTTGETFWTIALFCALIAGPSVAQECSTANGSVNIEYQCTSCTHGLLCQPEELEPIFEEDCLATEGCVDGAAGCTPVDELTEGTCGCLPTDSAYVDPYDPASYVICTGGQPEFGTCADGLIFDISSEECIAPPDCGDQIGGSLPIGSSCDTFLDCTPDDSGTKDCDPGTIYDYNTQDCIGEFSCDDQTADGQFADPLKCNVFHVCTGGVDYAHCCPYNMNYDEATGLCSPDAVCGRQVLNECKEAAYENEYCNYCSVMNEGDTYSTYLGTQCQTVYFECVAVEDSLEAQLKTCDDGSVFSQVSGLCEFIAAHPECTQADSTI